MVLNGFGRVGIFRMAREISVRFVSRRSGSTRWSRLQIGSKFVRTCVSSRFCHPSREVSRIRASSLAGYVHAERLGRRGDRAGERIHPAALFFEAFFT